MKKLLLISLLIPALSFSQKGFITTGPTVFINNKLGTVNKGVRHIPGLNLDAGIRIAFVSIGAGIDAYPFERTIPKFYQPHGDIRIWIPALNNRKDALFIAYQPGYTVYERNVLYKGRPFMYNVLAGVKSAWQGLDFFFACGYSHTKFYYAPAGMDYRGFKMSAGVGL